MYTPIIASSTPALTPEQEQTMKDKLRQAKQDSRIGSAGDPRIPSAGR